MRRVVSIALLAVLAATGSAQAVVFPPVEPPPPPNLAPEQPLPSGPGKLRVKQTFDPSKGIPIEGWTGYVNVTRVKSGQTITEEPLPLELNVPGGMYRVTGYWRTGSGAGTIDPATNFCSVKLHVSRVRGANVVVRRDARGCSMKVGAGREKRKCTGEGDRRRCTKVKKKPHEKPPTGPIGTPPCCKVDPPPTLRILPILGHDFGSVPVGGASAPKTFTMKNISPAEKGPVGIDLYYDSADYPVSNDTCTGQTLDPDEECTFDVTFTPLIPGFSIDTLNGTFPGGQGQGVGLRGTGV